MRRRRPRNTLQLLARWASFSPPADRMSYKNKELFKKKNPKKKWANGMVKQQFKEKKK